MKKAAAEAAAIVFLWLAAIAIANPRGNFPRLDDWDFTIVTWRFARTGHFLFTPFTAVSLRAQVLWGAAWTRLFGESFEVLRASTLLLGALTLIVVHRTLLEAGAGRFARVAGALALGFHPIFAWSSCTYMTEVPFVFVSSVALYCFARALNSDRLGFVVAGCGAIVLSWFVRQTGVVWAVAVLAAALLLREKLTARWRAWAVAAAATMALFGVLLLVKIEWISGAPSEFAVHYRVWKESSFRLPDQIELAYHWYDFNARNSGLFFLPLAAPALFLLRRRWIAFAAVALVLLARAQSLIHSGLPMPYFVAPFCCDVFAGYVLMNFGLGPNTLNGAYPIQLTMAARLLLTYASVIAGALLLVSLWTLRRPAGLAISFAVCATIALLGSGLYVDRYALDSAWALAVALPLVVPWNRAARITACVALALVALFDVCAIHDDFAWNRARWAALNDLRARGVPVQQIDAGGEPWAFYEIAYTDQRTRRKYQFGMPPRPYVITFTPSRGQTTIKTYPWRSWLGGREESVVAEFRGYGVAGNR